MSDSLQRYMNLIRPILTDDDMASASLDLLSRQGAGTETAMALYGKVEAINQTAEFAEPVREMIDQIIHRDYVTMKSRAETLTLLEKRSIKRIKRDLKEAITDINGDSISDLIQQLLHSNDSEADDAARQIAETIDRLPPEALEKLGEKTLEMVENHFKNAVRMSKSKRIGTITEPVERDWYLYRTLVSASSFCSIYQSLLLEQIRQLSMKLYDEIS